MEEKKSTAKWWLWFLVWSVILAILFIYKREYLWLAVPGFITYFVKGMNLIQENPK